ncbi:MAG TPA: exodeoxyribonuclease VII large subunit, partial [Paracoccus sp. (in: a-proteobacteria)]|nr:exodeoxyribonuclease VII large subunit [Paracoccus sp. (in: a-proteobacteria)]
AIAGAGGIARVHARVIRGARVRIETPTQRLSDLRRAMGRPQALTDPARQRLDLSAPRLEPVLRGFVRDRRARVEALELPVFAQRDFTRS